MKEFIPSGKHEVEEFEITGFAEFNGLKNRSIQKDGIYSDEWNFKQNKATLLDIDIFKGEAA